MDAPLPSCFLMAEGLESPGGDSQWRFVLLNRQTGESLSATDAEPGYDRDRLALLALVRGLEALSSPSRVLLVSACRYLRHGIREGRANWKANGWKWERFGRLVTVRDHDLWRRVDQALQIHQLECRCWRLNVVDHTRAHGARRASPEASRPTDATVGRKPSDYPEGYFREPALLVVRRPRRTLRLHDTRTTLPSDQRPARAAAS